MTSVADLIVCIVGGGHAAHTLAALLPWRGIRTRLFTAFGNEAELINQGIKEQGGIIANFASHNKPSGEIKGKPEIVSKDPSIVSGCNVILLPLPSFAYKDTLVAIKPHISKGAYIGATPGQGGFDYICRAVLGDEITDHITIFSITPMPFNCRIQTYGKKVNVQQFEVEYQTSASPQENVDKAAEVTKALLGFPVESFGHFLTCTLEPLNANIHPQHMYFLLKDWKEGQTFKEAPLFYETMGPETCVLMTETSNEVQKIAEVIRNKLHLNVKPMTAWESECTEFNDPNITIDQVFRESPAYKGFRAPFKKVGDVYVPDFNHRYYTEDVPYGLCVWKGIAELCHVPTPTIDKLITWAQARMGKEYLVGGKLIGKHVNETSAPQVYGVKNLEGLAKKMKSAL